MDLAFGTNVREHGYRIGRLAGLEMDRRTRAVRNIIITNDGTKVESAEKRPLAAVPMDHFDGDIVLNLEAEEPPVTAPDVLTLTVATRVMRGGREIGRLMGLELSPDTGELVSIVGRQHWWTRRFQIAAAGLDFSKAGEIGADRAATQAA
jgi:hypothetical protein